MRSLQATGWINFRMRAMLMSLASHPLWLHWRKPALFLARQFLDDEPGIHDPQAQAQSRVIGINTTRIYNPVKRCRDQDPDGVFIRRWVPELRGVLGDAVREPWLLRDTQLRPCGYPDPVVDLAVATQRGKRRRIHDRLSGEAAQREAQSVCDRHGSRHPGREPGRRRARSSRVSEAGGQMSLLGDPESS